MKKINVAIVVLLLCITCISCAKEVNNPTRSEEIANELQQIIGENAIKRVIPWDYNAPFPNAFYESAGTSFSFSKGFIRINTFGYDAYNLDKLKTYKIVKVSVMNDNGNIVSNEKALILYFN